MTNKQSKKPERSKERNKNDASSVINTSNLEETIKPSLYYGFLPIKTPQVTTDDLRNAKHVSEGEVVTDGGEHNDGLWVTLAEKVALLRTYVDKSLHTLSQPVMLIYDRVPATNKSNKNLYYSLDIIGAPKSIAEAIIIQTAYAMLTENGEKDLHIEINSIGDKESVARFTREFSAFYKKHIGDMPASARLSMKKDLFSVLSLDNEKCRELASECPKSVNFLSEKSRDHFKEVIEHLEALGIPYVINNSIVANRDYCTETIFEIRDDSKKTLAVGCRYDGLGKRLGHKKDMPAVGASVIIKKPTKNKKLSQKTIDRIMNPPISYIQLGFEAKLKSLSLIEVLRKADIAISHSLAKDKIGGQVASAEKNEARFVIIIGKKEAVENSVILRDNTNRSQDTVSLLGLPARLKKLKL